MAPVCCCSRRLLNAKTEFRTVPEAVCQDLYRPHMVKGVAEMGSCVRFDAGQVQPDEFARYLAHRPQDPLKTDQFATH